MQKALLAYFLCGSLQYGCFHYSSFANIQHPQLLHFSTDLDETGIEIHGL